MTRAFKLDHSQSTEPTFGEHISTFSEPKAQVWVPRGYGFWLFVPYDLQCGWTSFPETFNDCAVHGRDGPRKRIFGKIQKLKKLTFWNPTVVL